MMTKLPIKQYQKHTTLKIRGENNPTMMWPLIDVLSKLYMVLKFRMTAEIQHDQISGTISLDC